MRFARGDDPAPVRVVSGSAGDLRAVYREGEAVDLFYDGSQDVPLPFEDTAGKTGRIRPAGEPSFCESCNAPVSAEDLAGGGATEVYGLTLCEACREGERAEERVELYFCDRCQVSVPVYKVDTGEALAGDGRILCLACREGGERSRTVRYAALAAVLLLCFAAGAAWVSGTRTAAPDLGEVAPLTSIDPVGVDSAELLSGLEARMEAFASRLSEALRRMDDLEAGRLELSEKQAGSQELLRRMRRDFSLRMELLEAEAEALHRDLRRCLERPIPGR